jgi:hypothetical protein
LIRQCGECTLCCKLLPVRELKKAANTRCQFQQFHKGCKIYAKRPPSCAIWSCRWLTNQDTHDLQRPDQAHYVLDSEPDFVTVFDHKTQQTHKMPVIQLWIDPKFPKAYRDPALRRYLLRRSEEGFIGIARFNSEDAITLIPPTMASDRQWLEIRGEHTEEHTPAELLEFFDV